MQENKITIIINKPIETVFYFTTNPKNTHLWIPSIQEEIADEFPPRIGTQYRNHGKDSDWDFYKVLEYEPNKTFTLCDLEGNYHVKYSYKELNNNQTEMEYFEWMENGELKNPFTMDILQNLKLNMEKASEHV